MHLELLDATPIRQGLVCVCAHEISTSPAGRTLWHKQALHWALKISDYVSIISCNQPKAPQMGTPSPAPKLPPTSFSHWVFAQTVPSARPAAPHSILCRHPRLFQPRALPGESALKPPQAKPRSAFHPKCLSSPSFHSYQR